MRTGNGRGVLRKRRTRTTRRAATALLGLGLLLPCAAAALADPPAHAMAHGWRRRHEEGDRNRDRRDRPARYDRYDGRWNDEEARERRKREAERAREWDKRQAERERERDKRHAEWEKERAQRMRERFKDRRDDARYERNRPSVIIRERIPGGGTADIPKPRGDRTGASDWRYRDSDGDGVLNGRDRYPEDRRRR